MSKVYNKELAMEIKESIVGKDYNGVYDIIQDYAKKDLYTTLSYMYWDTDYPVVPLIRELGYGTRSASQLKKQGLLCNASRTMTCSKCGDTESAIVKSRRQLNDFKELPHLYECTKCNPDIPQDKTEIKPKVIKEIRVSVSKDNLDISYEAYLETYHWDSVRMRTFGMAGWKCQLCSSKGDLVAHHNNYNNLWNESVKDLVCLCKSCHTLFHSNMPCPK